MPIETRDPSQCPDCGAAIPPGQPKGLCATCALKGALELSNGDSQVLQTKDNANASPPQPVVPVGQLPTLKYFGDYELLEEIARGGMGVVYKARQASLNRIVAVKLLLRGEYAGEDFIKRFRIEASAAASLQHPNIVAIHEVGVHERHHYFAMDLVDGPNLAQLLRDGPLPAKRAAGYVKTIAEAIHFAHTRQILHRDLKPSNILIDSNDQPRVTDFGLAKQLVGTGSTPSDSISREFTDTVERIPTDSLTLSGQVLGSPAYMPPEQASGQRGKAGVTSDVYSLGAVLYHALTGRPPFVGQSVADTLKQVEDTEPIAPRLLNSSVPRDLETICLKCLEKEPAKRFPTAQQLADELGRFLNDEPIHARPTSRPEQVWRWCRRKPALASVLAGLCLVFTIAFVSVTWQWRRAENALALVTTILKQSESEDDDEVIYTGCFSRDRRKEFRIHPDGSASLTVSPQPLPYPVTFPFNPNDPHFARPPESTTNDVRTMLLWPASGAPAAEKNVKTQELRMAKFSASGEFLAIVQTGRGVQLWDAILGKRLIPLFQSDEGDIISAGFTPDSSFLVTRSDSGDIGVWNVRTGERRGFFHFQSPAASPLGRHKAL